LGFRLLKKNKKAIMRKKRFRIKKPIYKKKLFWFLILGFFLFCFFIWFLFFSRFFLVEKLSAREPEIDNFLKEKEKENFLKKELNFLFLLNWKKIQREILENFPEIKEVKLKILGFRRFEVEIEKRKGIFNFCVNEKCYLFDEKGIAFKEGNDPNLIVIEGEKEASIKKEIFPEKMVQGVLNIKKDFDNMGVKIDKIKIGEERLEVLTSQGYIVIFDPEKDISFQLKKFEVGIKNIPKEKIEKLDYIDLRFSNFAVPKFKD